MLKIKKKTAKRIGLTAVLLVLAAVVLVSVFFRKNGEQAPENADKDPGTDGASMISGLLSDVTAENASDYDFTQQAMAYLAYLGTELPDRDSTDKSSDHDAAREWIISELKKAEYSDDQIEVQTFYGGNAGGDNIILTVEGEDPSHQIIAGGHYDGDGIGDNGSGIALLLANAVGLAGQKPHYTVKYIFFDCEELGLVGSSYYADHMSDAEAENTIYMINLDSLVFGDYCNIYGEDPYGYGGQASALTEVYEFAADLAEALGFTVMRTADLDGYFAEHGTGPEIREGTLYTNPWTQCNPPPINVTVFSPATLPASDQVGFQNRGIAYIYFEATNWFAGSGNHALRSLSYTGYIETYDDTLGEHGMFMNTDYDTWENLNLFFPGRAQQHYRIYSPLLSALIMVK